MVWLIADVNDVEKVARPAASSATVATTFPLSMKVTVPDGVPIPGCTGETVAVNVTDWPTKTGFADALIAVTVGAGFTVSDKVVEVLDANVLLPTYLADKS